MNMLTMSYTRMQRLVIVLIAFAFSVQTVWAIDLDLSTNPMDVQQGVDPNVIFTMDDSGSMAWSYLPDGISGRRTTNRAKSSEFNLIYYDPTVSYVPGVDENGVSLGDATFTAAWDNGYNKSTCTINLATSFRPTWRGQNNCNASVGSSEYGGPAEPAYYYQYNTACGNTNSDACYSKVVVGAAEQQNFANWYSYYRKRHLLAKTASTRAFAKVSQKVRLSRQCLNDNNNSNTSYRCRTPSLVQQFSGTARKEFFDWLHQVPASGGTPLLRAVENAGAEYSKGAADKSSPYRNVPRGPSEAVQPGDDNEYACRQNFHIAFTDGSWNTYQPSIGNVDNQSITLPGFNAAAGDRGKDFGVNSYTPMAPFRDTNNNFLADIAMLYWATDLRPDLDNVVPQYIPDKTGTDAQVFWNPDNDPAHWQHMVNFTVSMGLAGNLDPQVDKNDIYSGAKTWDNNHVDDLWHAAINGRGEYFTADNPTTLVDRFTKVLNAISERQGSSTAPATSFPLFAAGSIVFQPRFNSGDWTGDLIAIDVTNLANGINFGADLDQNKVWSAADALDAMAVTDRHIMTYDPDVTPAGNRGIALDWSKMTTNGVLQTALNKDRSGTTDSLGADRVDYFLGKRDEEESNGGAFRNRNSLLGDLVNSTPVFVGSPFRDFRDDMEAGEAYSKFKDDKCNRPRVIYVGSNDGMLHGFNAGTFDCALLTATPGDGKEVMAFVPSAVYRKLSNLTDPIYESEHRFFVDGSPTEADVFFGGIWHTIITAGLNGGGQGVYALDVTSGVFDKTKATDTVLWEFSDLNDEDLGYTFSQPRVVRLNSGSWAVTFGNGYNNTEDDTAVGGQRSTSGNAVLYIVDAETGNLVKKIDTGVGLSDPASGNSPNGLATVEPIDVNDDRIADYIYGGDLYGNLWRFDVSSSDTAQWRVDKVFVASYQSGGSTIYQPITAAPKVVRHPSGQGAVVIIGTGKHIELSDLTDLTTQTMYGVWDRLESSPISFDRDVLYEQKIIGTQASQFTESEARVTTKDEFVFATPGGALPGSGSNTWMGWFMDLYDPDDIAQPFKGEKMVKNMVVRGQRIIFVSDVPSDDPCQAGGSSWLNELNAVTGSRLPETPFDYDFDGQFTVSDLVQGDFDGDGQDVVGSGIRHRAPGGKFSAPTIIRDIASGPGREKKLVSNSDGTLSMMDEQDDDRGLGRRSWRQVVAP